MTDLQTAELVITICSTYGMMLGITQHLYSKYTEIEGKDNCTAVAIFWPVTFPVFLGLKLGVMVDWVVGEIKRSVKRFQSAQELKNRARRAEVAIKEAETKKMLTEIDRELRK